MNEYTKYLVLKSAIEDLFGSEAWYALKESNHLLTWRKYAIKTLKAIKTSIEETIEIVDNDWRKQVDLEIDGGIDRAKKDGSIDEIIATLAGTLIRIAFMQIGNMPHRKGSRKVGSLRKENWKLNAFRTVIYLQTEEQKERLFWSYQQRNIGFDNQIDLHTEYRRSRSDLSYSEWCEERGVGLTKVENDNPSTLDKIRTD